MRRTISKITIFMLIILMLYPIFSNETVSAYSPFDVESSVRNNWNNNYGFKNNDMRSGRNIIYDIYSEKYDHLYEGGYRIVNRNFGNGNQPFLNFRGWAINFGYKRHNYTNHDTYIVAQKVGSSTTKIYKANRLNISATKDLEYNKQTNNPDHVWNECPASATNKDNQYDCNMRYDNVGIDVYLPLNELFPNPTENARWRLYLVKKVDNHIVYTELKLPFEFSGLKYQGGEIKLSSGVNARRLTMIGTNVIKREYPRQVGLTRYGYFNTGNTYTQRDVDETETAVWYGVSSDNTILWASTAYWDFGGDQAILSFTPDSKPPEHISHGITGHRYKNGDDYWIQPNDSVNIRLRGKDEDSLLWYTSLRLQGNGETARARHYYGSGSLEYFDKSNVIAIPSSNTSYQSGNSQTREATYSVSPNSTTHGHTYVISAYHTDNARNAVGWVNTGMRLRVDGVGPERVGASITGARYTEINNGITDYWVQPNDTLTVALRQHDPHSGNHYQYLRLVGNQQDVRSYHNFRLSDTQNIAPVNSSFQNTSAVSIDSATRTENTSYGRVQWTVTPKRHGDTFNVQHSARDNVGNYSEGSYGDINRRIRTDGEAPTVTFNPHLMDWVNTNITVTIDVNDAHSGVKQFRYRVQNGDSWGSWSSWINDTSTTVTLTNNGRNRIQVQADDNVENRASVYSGYYYIDKVNPNIIFSPNSQDWTEGTINVNVNITDEHSGVKRFRYRIQNEGTWGSWSSWINGDSRTISLTQAGRNRIQVEAEDNAGNMNSAYSGYYYINNPPIADFDYTPKPAYEGDDVLLVNLSTDPDGHSMTAEWEILDPEGNISNQNTWNARLDKVIPGIYVVKLTVTDSPGATDTVIKQFTVRELTITGAVDHTPLWKQYHESLGHPLHYFYSGEKFIVNANVTDYPIEYVKVEFNGKLRNGSTLTLVEDLTAAPHPNYIGEVYDEIMSDSANRLANGKVQFLFTAKWTNGTIKTDLVEVEIIGTVHDHYNFYRSN